MTRLHMILTSVLVLSAAGCDGDKVAQLEKQNAEIKAQLVKQNATTDFDLQAKCSTAAKTWFNENWSRDKDTILLDHSSHYNAKQNKCFILVEYHYNSHFGGPGTESWANSMTIMDVFENAKYADFGESHITHFKPTTTVDDHVITCNVQGNNCKTMEEFNNLIRPYMND